MNEIYVVGHRNPDTDSIVAAMSYAALRNALGDRDYVAAYLGHVSDETQRLLNRFGFQPPQLIQNVRTQVSDLDYDTPPALNATVTMDRAWHIMREQRISAIPVVNEDGTLYGTLSAGDIATYSMNTISEPRVEALPLFNLLSVIEGRVLNDTGDLVDSVTGDVVIALPQSCENLLWNGKDHIVLCAAAWPNLPARWPDPLPDGGGSGAAGRRQEHLHHLQSLRCQPGGPSHLSGHPHLPPLPH